MKQLIGSLLATAMVITPTASTMAQTRPTPAPEQPTTRPLPAPAPRPPVVRPLPAPIPETKPAPLPQPLPSPGYRPGQGGNWQYQGYRAETQCAARGDRQERCRVRTENRVTLVNRYNGKCRLNRDWGFDSVSIWVRNKCRASFAYGYGRFYPDGGYDYHDDDKGPDAGLIIGGVVVAAGLIALLSKSKKNVDDVPETSETAPPPPTGGMASLDADLTAVAANVRPSLQACLNETAKQIGATGGTKVKFDGITKLEEGNGGWRINGQLIVTYPGGDSPLPMFCRATPTKVIELDFIA
jgi:Protein of unknown function (DUF3011)